MLMAGQLWTGSSYVPSNAASAFDGDGQRMEEVLSYPATFTTRYLRSSAMGGEIAQEINSAGQTISYVYLPDGTQLSTLIGFPKWRHETPTGTGLYENYQSGFVNRVEFDPVRANVGLTAPPPPDTNGGDGDIGGNHNGGPSDSRFSDMSNPAAGCYSVGGVDLPCTWSVFDVLDFFVWTPARNAGASSAPSESLATWVPPKRLVPLNIPNPFTQLLSPDDGDTVAIGTNYIPGHWNYAPAPFLSVNSVSQTRGAKNPQNPANLLPQEPVTNNPAVIDNSGSANQSCSIQISFTGSYGQLLNGPSIPNSPEGPVYGIGFSIGISELSGNVAIRSTAQDPKPTGTWLVEQWVADFNFKNGKVVRHDTAGRMENLAGAVPRPRRDGDTVSWWDHPGTLATDVQGYFTKRNFYVKAYNGERHCEVAFHLTFRVFNGRMTDTGWGPGLYN
jgi:hypothetical protein